MRQRVPDGPCDKRRASLRARRIRRGRVLLTLLLLGLAGCRSLTTEERQLEEQGRASASLDGIWQVWLDPGAVGLSEGWAADLSAGRRPAGSGGDPLELVVPGPLEAAAPTLGYDGVAFYVREFRAPSRLNGCRVRLRFGQVNFACRAWLDGEPIGEHEGGYDAFEIDVTDRLADGGSHRLVLMVIDPGATPVLGFTLKTTPHGKESWYENFGGLLGPVSLECDRGFVPSSLAVRADPVTQFISVRGTLLAPPGRGGRTARLALDVSPVVDAAVAAGRAADPPDVSAAGASAGAIEQRFVDVPVGADGRLQASLDIRVPSVQRWSPETPRLYRVVVSVDGRAVAERRVGFRSVTIERGDLLVNGERRVLKGVLWQPHFTGTGGLTPPAAELEQEVRDILDTGFNLVRVHVRPAPPAFLDAADRLGLLVLEEPAIGWVEDDPGLLPRLQHELDWMVERDGHHPAIILWGVLNELSGKAWRHTGALTAHLAALDPGRPVLEDSGGFMGEGRYVPPRRAEQREPVATLPMIDRHIYPPWPLPPESRDELSGLGGPDDLVFVSEYGYGTLPDTVAAVKAFRERGVLDEERIKFESYAATARRAAASGEALRAESWVGPAAEEQADAAEDMTEALRSNPALDLLCYTQWRAVSSECSAGLLEPWGASRPARASMRRALRPLLAAVLPGRPSVAVGEALPCRVALVNDTGAPLRARALLHWTHRATRGNVTGDIALGPLEHGGLDLPPGVTHRDVTLPAFAVEGSVVLVARLTSGERLIEQSTERTLAVVAPLPPLAPRWIAVPAGPARGARAMLFPRIWASPGDAAARAFLRRQGQDVVADSPAGAEVALISRPDRLDELLSLDDQVELWSLVRRGGAAIVLLPDPADDEMTRHLGPRGGVRTLTALPVPVAVGVAAGTFMGRVHVLRSIRAPEGLALQPGPLELLGRGGTAFSPRAMILGDPPAGGEVWLVTLGHLGNRLGAPGVETAFGRGRITLIGWPLLEPIRGAVDPEREKILAFIAQQAALAAHERLAAPSEGLARAPPLPAALARELAADLAALDRLVAFGDRSSPFLGLGAPGRLPDKVAGLPGRRAAALAALLEGRPQDARELLQSALEPIRTADTEQVLALEGEVLKQLGLRVGKVGRDTWDDGYAAVEDWARGVTAWFTGDARAAHKWLEQARRVLEVGAAGAARTPGAPGAPDA